MLVRFHISQKQYDSGNILKLQSKGKFEIVSMLFAKIVIRSSNTIYGNQNTYSYTYTTTENKRWGKPSKTWQCGRYQFLCRSCVRQGTRKGTLVLSAETTKWYFHKNRWCAVYKVPGGRAAFGPLTLWSYTHTCQETKSHFSFLCCP